MLEVVVTTAKPPATQILFLGGTTPPLSVPSPPVLGGVGGKNTPSPSPSPQPQHTYSKKSCMHGGQSKTNNIAVYSVNGGQNPVYQAFGATVAIDNDGDPNCNKRNDFWYNNETSYNTGLSGQANFLDGTKVAYIALRTSYFTSLKMPVHLGDVVLLTNSATGASTYAIVGDVGNSGELGEMSLLAVDSVPCLEVVIVIRAVLGKLFALP